MSVNRYRQHVFVIPEDRRNAEIANGFLQHPGVSLRQIQVAPEAGGWRRVLDTFSTNYVRRLQTNPMTHVVLLIDFDNDFTERARVIQSSIPTEIQDRVFVIGALDEPERLKRNLGQGYEAIGYALADDCDNDSTNVWDQPDLRHNEAERRRLMTIVRPFLFGTEAE